MGHGRQDLPPWTLRRKIFIRLLRWSILFRTFFRLPEQAKTEQAETSSREPWWESNLLWGSVGLVVAIPLTVVAAMLKDLRYLIVAWPFGCLTAWALSKASRVPGWRVVITICGSAVVTGGLIYLNAILKPPTYSVAPQSSSAESSKAKESNPVPNNPGRPTGKTPSVDAAEPPLPEAPVPIPKSKPNLNLQVKGWELFPYAPGQRLTGRLHFNNPQSSQKALVSYNRHIAQYLEDYDQRKRAEDVIWKQLEEKISTNKDIITIPQGDTGYLPVESAEILSDGDVENLKKDWVYYFMVLTMSIDRKSRIEACIHTQSGSTSMFGYCIDHN